MIQTRKAEQVAQIIKPGLEPKGLADRIRVVEGILEKVSVAAKAAFKRAVAADSLQKLVIEPLKKFEERITRYKCYVSTLHGANVVLNKLSVTENKAGRSAMVCEFRKMCESMGATPLALVTNWLMELIASGVQ